MKYRDKFKDRNLIHLHMMDDHVFYTDVWKECSQCQKPTKFIDVNFGAAFCSEECYDKAADVYSNVSYIVSKPKLTNYDQMKLFNLEDMAKCITDGTYCDNRCAYDDYCSDEGCLPCCIDWLRERV